MMAKITGGKVKFCRKIDRMESGDKNQQEKKSRTAGWRSKGDNRSVDNL